MALFRKKATKEQVPPVDKSDPGALLRDEIIGVSDWKHSKIGYLTGFSSVRRAVSNIGSSWSDAASRTSGLFRDLTKGEQAPALEEEISDAKLRFEASMRLHGRTERDLAGIVLNTYRSGLLYLGITVAAFAFGLVTIYLYPPQGVIQVIARFGPTPLIVALTLKHLYTNWMVRRRSLDGIGKFLASGEWLPKKAA